MKETSEYPNQTLRTVVRAFEFLEVVATSPKPVKIKEVASILKLNQTTAYHFLRTLRDVGYIDRDAGGFLRVGHRVTVLYNGMLRQQVLGLALRTVIEDLCSLTKETAYLTLRSKDGLVVETLVEGNQAVRVKGLEVGFSGAEHIRASGLAALAFMNDVDREAVLTKSLISATDDEKRDVIHNLIGEFEVIRSQGWAVDNERFEKDVCCVAAPFFRDDGTVAGSIGVSVPASRFQDTQQLIIDSVCAKSQFATKLVGGR
jgi:DNA-binding IclR family transcriptional regulator